MLQRAMVAAAIISEPKLLICDEPTTALDVTIQEGILNLLKKINREKGTGILLSPTTSMWCGSCVPGWR